MDTIHCGIVMGEAIQKIQEIKDAINVLASSGDDFTYVRTILEVKADDIWSRCIANRIREYPIDAYKSFVGREIRKENT